MSRELSHVCVLSPANIVNIYIYLNYKFELYSSEALLSLKV